ncbi:MAG: PRC-barrel domain-containing protein [Rhodobacteraceae bacterium]|nr:PRC-barrel domain-containing protein [Paracoccaceae bacterium]
MRTLLAASTALSLVFAAPLAADETPGAGFTYTPSGAEIHASRFIGARVYVADRDVSADETWASWDGTATDWDDVGEIHDMLMSKDGGIEAILVDVGGFLGMGEKQVAVSMDKLKLVPDGPEPDDYFVVFTASQEMLEAAPVLTVAEATQADAAPADVAKPRTLTEAAKEAAQDAADSTVAAGEALKNSVNGLFVAPEITRDGYSAAEAEDLTTEALTGARVYDANDEWIGEVDELLLGDDGQITEAVIHVGGLLGFGEKPVAVNFDALTIQKEDAGDDLRVYLDATEKTLLESPEYHG